MSKNTILLVEDNPNDQLLAERALRNLAFPAALECVHDGYEALAYLNGTGRFAGRETDDVPALVLLDMQLPKLSGLEVLRYMRANERTRLVPVVVLTSSADEMDVAAGYGAGCNSYIRKPVDFVRFSAVLGGLLDYWLNLNQPPILGLASTPPVSLS